MGYVILLWHSLSIPYNYFDLMEWAFKREVTLYMYLACNERKAFSRLLAKGGINFGHVKMYVTPYRIAWIIFI